MANRSFDQTIRVVAVIGSLVLLNILSQRYFARLDLTHDQRYTLSEATVGTLTELSDPLTVRAYFTSDLPPPFSTSAHYTRDLLEEYHAASDGKVRFEFVDPVSEETAEDREKKKEVKRDIFGRQMREQTSVEQEMQTLGIPPVQVQLNEDDKVEVKRAYMGLAVHHGDKTEVIPMVQDTSGLEYDLTTLIRKMTREKSPKIAVIAGHEGPSPRDVLSKTWGVMSQLYDVVELNLQETPEIPEDVSAILVIGPKTPFSEDEQKAIDTFIASGKSVAFMVDATSPDFQNLTAGEVNHGLGDMLATYGVKIPPGLVVDAESATINVGQQRGHMQIMQPVKYPLIPQPKSLEANHALTRGLSQVAFPFMSPLEVTVPQGSDLRAEVLVKSSPKSWVQEPPYDLNPMQKWSADSVGTPSAKNLVVALSGPIPSHFPQEGQEKHPGRVVVIGGSAFVNNQFLAPGNQALVLNLLDWLVLDDALLAVRTRGLDAAPLEELDVPQKTMIRYANVIGLPIAAVLFGIGRWRWRERRRSRVHL